MNEKPLKKLSDESIKEYYFLARIEDLKNDIKKKCKKELQELEKEKTYLLRHSVLTEGIEESFQVKEEFYQKGIQDSLKEIELLQREYFKKDEEREENK